MTTLGATRGLTTASGMVGRSYIILGNRAAASQPGRHAAILSDNSPTASPKKSDWFQRRIAWKFAVVR